MNPFEEARNQLDTCIDALKRASAIYNNTPGKKEEGKIRLKMARDMEEVCNLLDRTLIGAALKAGKGGEIKATDFTGRVLIDGQGKMKTDTGSMERLEIDDLAAEWEVVEDDTSDQE